MKSLSEPAAHQTTINQLKGIIEKETGIVINNERIIDLEIVLQNRLIVHKMEKENYLEFLKNDYEELIIFASFFTIQETSFYRYRAHFDRLKMEVLPEIITQKREEARRSILILSAGCSTGEEPYTIAMIINDLLKDQEEWKIRIVATDINKSALQMAAEGVYSEYKLRNIDSWYVNRYFEKNENGKKNFFRIKDCVKELVTFRHCNLIREPFELQDLQEVDVIFCENVMIYFCHDSIQRLIDNFYQLLKKDGHLFLGYSETLNLIKHKFNLSWWNDSFNYRKEEAGSVAFTARYEVKGQLPEPADEKLAGINAESYGDFIQLIIRNYKAGLEENVRLLLKKLENSNIKIDESFYLIKAEFQLEKHDYLNAANECRKAISMNPQSLDAHLLLGAIYLELDMLDSAAFEIKTALYINDTSILGYYYYALFNKKVNNEAEYKSLIVSSRKLLNEARGVLETHLYPINPYLRKKIFDELLL